ncbi:hypothetical protein [Rubrobacter marinus]|uniref:hypothetical protein n=1 Tax=Rubrobacter marinus TaxID=2653852 RepID=UPI001407A304|nr:hypothetical protein [Rubrobacter marinus]
MKIAKGTGPSAPTDAARPPASSPAGSGRIGTRDPAVRPNAPWASTAGTIGSLSDQEIP